MRHRRPAGAGLAQHDHAVVGIVGQVETELAEARARHAVEHPVLQVIAAEGAAAMRHAAGRDQAGGVLQADRATGIAAVLLRIEVINTVVGATQLQGQGVAGEGTEIVELAICLEAQGIALLRQADILADAGIVLQEAIDAQCAQFPGLYRLAMQGQAPCAQSHHEASQCLSGNPHLIHSSLRSLVIRRLTGARSRAWRKPGTMPPWLHPRARRTRPSRSRGGRRESRRVRRPWRQWR